MLFSLDQITELFVTYRYALIFPLTVLEGPIVTVIGSFLASQGYLNVYAVYAISVVGDLVGDVLYYGLGRFGRHGFIDKYGKYLLVPPERVKELEGHFGRHSGKTLVIGKLTHAMGVFVLVSAGIAKVPFGQYLLYNFLPTLPKSLAFVMIGFYFGKAFGEINSYLEWVAFGGTALVLLALLLYFIPKAIARYARTDHK